MTKFFTEILINLYLKANGIIIKQASTISDLQNAYHLRWEIYKKEGYINEEYDSQKILDDKYDNKSIVFIAKHKEKTIGTVRLILFSDMGFPTNNAFNLINFSIDKTKIAELSKLCVEKKYRGKYVSMGLLKNAYDYSVNNKISYWIMGMPEILKNKFSKIGLCFIEIQSGKANHEQLLERKTAQKYFEKSEIKPYLLKI